MHALAQEGSIGDWNLSQRYGTVNARGGTTGLPHLRF